jgi:predicted transglutaminase-like cysteine proteinase
MYRLPLIATLAAGSLLAGCATTPNARVAPTLRLMADGPSIDAPRGFVEMCESDPAMCVAGEVPVANALFSDAVVGDARALGKTLRKVNRLVNSRVRQRTDEVAFGRTELWQRSGIGWAAEGDCEDLAIEKRERLIEAGVPRGMLFFATAYRPDLGLHTVLVARTDDGDLVLDSRTPYIARWYDAPYQWISRQHPDDPMRWSMVRDPQVTRTLIALAAPTNADGATAALASGSRGTRVPLKIDEPAPALTSVEAPAIAVWAEPATAPETGSNPANATR